MKDCPRSLARAALVIALCSAAFPSEPSWARPHFAPQAASSTAKAASAVLAELLEWVGKYGRKIASVEAVDDVTLALQKMRSAGTEVSGEVSALLKRDLAKITAGKVDEVLLAVLSSKPSICEPAWNIVVRTDLRDLGPRVKVLAQELGEKAPRVFKAIDTQCDNDATVALFKGLSGRQLSRRQVEEIADAFRKTDLDSVARGEAFECVARAQLSHGVQKSQSGLRDGSRVICGKYNEVNGIDGIGVAADGRPVIFEFTMDRQKDLASTKQLSPDWTTDRWNRLLQEKTSIKDELKQAGIDDRWLRQVTAEDARSWPRKLVAANESAINEANRLAAEIKMDDLFVLGGR